MSENKPLYQQILEYLREKITSRQLLPGQQLPTEFELAEQFGVSRITSKRALEELEKEGYIYRKRGHGSFVSPSVIKTANNGIGKVVSIIFPYHSAEGWVMTYIKGAMDYLNPRGYFLSIHCTGGENERDYLNQLTLDGVGGIIYYPSSTVKNIDILTTLCMNNYPVVTIDKYFDGIPLSHVVSDNFNGEYMLVKHMVELGHRRIAYVCADTINNKSSLRDRYLGYCKALKDHGLEIDQEIIFLDYYTRMIEFKEESKQKEFLREKLKSMIDSGVTAMLAENDVEAITIYKILTEIDVKIPQQVSLAGFDNIELLKHFELPLTTINQNFYEIGKRAAQLVVKSIEEKSYKYVREIIPVELIKGETTASPSTK